MTILNHNLPTCEMEPGCDAIATHRHRWSRTVMCTRHAEECVKRGIDVIEIRVAVTRAGALAKQKLDQPLDVRLTRLEVAALMRLLPVARMSLLTIVGEEDVNATMDAVELLDGIEKKLDVVVTKDCEALERDFDDMMEKTIAAGNVEELTVAQFLEKANEDRNRNSSDDTGDEPD